MAKFSGNVTVRQGERRLRADRAAYYREQDRVEIEGEVQYREPGLLVQGESAVINTADESGVLRKARFVMHSEHTRGEGRRGAAQCRSQPRPRGRHLHPVRTGS